MKKSKCIFLVVFIVGIMLAFIETAMFFNSRSISHGHIFTPPIATTIDGTPLSNTPDNPAGEWEGPKD